MSLKIINHRLIAYGKTSLKYIASPNRGGRIDAHEYLIMHYSAGRCFDSCVNWLTHERAKASAHLVIGRQGEVAQLVPFDRVSWHAGHSKWANRTKLNQCSIGIELDNGGRLMRQGRKWVTWFGCVIPDDDVVIATHKNESSECGWHAFTEVQIKTAKDVASALIEHYHFTEILGHDDIAPLRKCDPGPAFPLDSFRAHVLGRGDTASDVLHCTTTLNIRGGPGTEYSKFDEGPLPQGTRVVILDSLGVWRFVDVLDSVDPVTPLHGWVHSRYLQS